MIIKYYSLFMKTYCSNTTRHLQLFDIYKGSHCSFQFCYI